MEIVLTISTHSMLKIKCLAEKKLFKKTLFGVLKHGDKETPAEVHTYRC